MFCAVHLIFPAFEFGIQIEKYIGCNSNLKSGIIKVNL